MEDLCAFFLAERRQRDFRFTQSASVEVSSFSLSELDIDSLSGDIDVSGISADYISLSSVSGAIRADSVEASVFECTSTSGNVRATLSADDVVFFQHQREK
jgi:DUF4097 and DUF4098 domain-containing protein YvlB